MNQEKSTITDKPKQNQVQSHPLAIDLDQDDDKLAAALRRKYPEAFADEKK